MLYRLDLYTYIYVVHACIDIEEKGIGNGSGARDAYMKST